MKRYKVLKFIQEFMLFFCTITTTKIVAVHMLNKESFWLEALIFVITYILLNGLYELIKFIIKKINGNETKANFKQQLHNIIFIIIIFIILIILYFIFG